MHIEKNMFDNVFNTIMDTKDKIKDNVKVRMDLKKYYKQRDLELQELANRKVMKLKAKFILTMEQKKAIYKQVKELKIPDGYASNLCRCVNLKEINLFRLKSYDCHVFIEYLLPIAFSALPD